MGRGISQPLRRSAERIHRTPALVLARAPIWIGALTLLSSATACFYDHRWLQQYQAQQAALKNAKPAELRAAPASPAGETEIPASPAKRILRVRVHATARYAAEVIDWRRQLTQLLDAAGGVLEPTLGVRIEVADTAAWASRGDDGDISGRLDELAALDDGSGVDWVIGLLGSVPRAELSYHELGMAKTPGKHIVMRAMNDAREHEAIERAFVRHGEEERRKLYRSRKQHKTVTVFLHEIGHTLGVPHEVDPASIMHTRYEPKASGFSDAAAGLMRLSLARTLEPEAQTPQAFAAAFAAKLEASPDVWVPADRDALLARFRGVAATPPSSKPGRKAWAGAGRDTPAAPAGDGLETLSITDRNTFNRAVADKQAGRVREAWEGVKPLFKAYPDVLAIQELRCQLAMAMGGAFDQIQAECARLTELSTRPR